VKAQGEKRGHLTKTDEPEAQFAGGEGGGGSEVARRTIAQKAYRDRVARFGWHEVWSGGKLTHYRAANPDRSGAVQTHALTERAARALFAQRVAAYGY